MQYTIRHITWFRYSAPVHESVMELRMQPRTEGIQRCLGFDLAISPAAKISRYDDYMGNTVHTFDIPARHRHLTITAAARVALDPPPAVPPALGPAAWDELDQMVSQDDYFELLLPSERTMPTRALRELADELVICRRDDPLTVLRQMNTGIYRAFSYEQSSTTVDSPIDEALRKRRGVCQDFAHIMIALVRDLGIPCRYVSGYLFHRRAAHDRSVEDATHAWVEALLPGLGWVGFDPTNNLICGERHIRVAVGRDYNAVPPTRGVFKGDARSELGVSVQVHMVAEEADEVASGEVDSITYHPLPELQVQQQQQQQQ